MTKTRDVIKAAEHALFVFDQNNPHINKLRDCILDIQTGHTQNITELATVLEKAEDWEKSR